MAFTEEQEVIVAAVIQKELYASKRAAIEATAITEIEALQASTLQQITDIQAQRDSDLANLEKMITEQQAVIDTQGTAVIITKDLGGGGIEILPVEEIIP